MYRETQLPDTSREFWSRSTAAATGPWRALRALPPPRPKADHLLAATQKQMDKGQKCNDCPTQAGQHTITPLSPLLCTDNHGSRFHENNQGQVLGTC